MSVFTAKKLKEARNLAGMSQDEAANAMKISRRRLQTIEANDSQVTSDEIVDFAKLYHVDVRELLLESYNEEEQERILSNRYGSLTKLYDQLSDRDKEDVIWVIKQRIEGRI
ncbi:MAG: helix-turn-helix transcriptional regulator [Lachnospiraceae bacterium]|nr:helix-turn-helix transcriptional regulator [Lachnospiraceae bacterium]